MALCVCVCVCVCVEKVNLCFTSMKGRVCIPVAALILVKIWIESL